MKIKLDYIKKKIKEFIKNHIIDKAPDNINL